MKNLSQFIYILFNVCCMFFIINCEEEAYFENVSDSEDLIDPHSFFYDKHNKRMIKESGENIKTEDTSEKIMSENKDTKECNCVSQVNNCENHEIVFYKRLINLLLANINIKEEDDISLVGVLEIEISHAQMKILQDFHPQKISLRKVDEILSHVIKKPQYIFGVIYFFDSLLNKFEMAFKIIQDHPDGAIIVFLILMMGLMLRMLKQNRRFPLFIMIQIIFVSSFFMTWWQLVQEAEIKAVAQQMKFANVPISCQPDKMTMWDKFVSFVTSNEDCEKYYEAMMSNPKLKITPAHALSHFITTVILHPVTHIGTVISVFINNATDGLSWTYAWIIKFMLFLCVAVVIIMIPMCLSGAALNFGIGPLLRFGIDYKKRDRKGNSLEYETKREPIQIILQVQQGTSVPAVTDAPATEQLNQIEMTKTNVEKNDTKIIDTDLSSGDTIKSIEFLKHDEEEFQQSKNVVENETKCNDGSGDK